MRWGHLGIEWWLPIAAFFALVFAVNFICSSLSSARPQGPNPNLCACPDCHHDVSRRATSCPRCGCPLSANS